MKKNIAILSKTLLVAALLSSFQLLAAQEKTVDITLVNSESSTKGIGEKIGTVTFQDSDKGLVIRPDLKGLAPGEHGFHIHANPSCDANEVDGKWVAAMAAGGHFDPAHTAKHSGPTGQGHLGDLPVLVVDHQGMSQVAVVAPKLKLSDVMSHSIMIHDGGDNYSDEPKPMGGGGARVACGVIQ